MKKFFTEFKAFVLRGNVMNLAVGVIIGASFQGIVTSLTDNIISPILGLFMGLNFDELIVGVYGVEIRYGAFITSVINFFIMAFVIFLLVKSLSAIMSIGKKPEEPAKSAERFCPFCTTPINEKAVRCPACTSELPLETEQGA